MGSPFRGLCSEAHCGEKEGILDGMIHFPPRYPSLPRGILLVVVMGWTIECTRYPVPRCG